MDANDYRLNFKESLRYLEREHGVRYTLNTWRRYQQDGTGPKFHHVGGRLHIWRSELDHWVTVRTRDVRPIIAPLPPEAARQLAEWRAQGKRWRWVTWCRPCDLTIWMVPEVIEP